MTTSVIPAPEKPAPDKLVPDAALSFDDFKLPSSLLRAVRELKYTTPSPIQAMALPPALEGRDVLGTAMTGSGKTAAFLLPILTHLLTRPRGVTRALILAPTRELAAQIEQSAKDLMKFTPLRVASIFGGVGMQPQEKAFKSGVDVLVATPGRLLDHFSHSYARLTDLEILVLDEADRMLDMGFLPDIRRVMRHLPTKRQTLFFSATMPDAIEKLSGEMLVSPVRVGVERKAAPASGVNQTVYPVPEDLKAELLLALLGEGTVKDVIVFTRTKHRANRVAEKLVRAGISAERIHGNRSQTARTEALAGFKSGKYRVLVATDIAARGIDVESLGHVVNFDVPNVPDDYIHRVGRTARAGQSGEAITFCSPAEEPDLKAIEKAVGRKIPRDVVNNFDYRAKKSEKLEVPIGVRVAEIKARKAEDRARATSKAQASGTPTSSGPSQGGGGRGGSSGSSGSASGRPAPVSKSPRYDQGQPAPSSRGGGRRRG